MGGTPRAKTKPGPSYEDGRLRDPAIEEKFDSERGESDLLALIKKAARAASKPLKHEAKR